MIRKLIIFLFFILICDFVTAQNNNPSENFSDLQEQVAKIYDSISTLDSTLHEIQESNKHLHYENSNLKDSLEAVNAKITDLQNLIRKNEVDLKQIDKKLTQTASNLNQQIDQTRAKSEEQFGALNQAVNAKWLYGIIAFLLLALLALVGYLVLNKKVHNKEQKLEDNIAQTRKELETEAIRLDEKLVQIMESQLKVMQEEQQTDTEEENKEQDHSLALKVADEIVRIEKNLSKMDENTKGLKQLTKAVQRIKDNFAASGYEMVELLNKPYNEGLKVYASFTPDENLEPDQAMITRIIKPQVKFQGEMIQPGQVEVSQPPK